MNEMERDLHDAMAARASGVEPQNETEALARIEGRLSMNRRRWISLAGAAAVIFVVAGALVLLTRGDDKQHVNLSTDSSNGPSTSTTSTSTSIAVTSTTPAAGPTPSSAPSSEPAPTTTAPSPPTPPPPHVWPLSDEATYATPEDAATSFVHDYLGMIVDVRGATTADETHASVEFFANSNGAGRMLVDLVRHLDSWYVIGARADEIVVDTPQPNDPIKDPLTVSGRSVAFEAQLGLQLRPLWSTSVVSTGQAMGGSTEMQPFSTTMSAPRDAAAVLIVFEGDARGEQTFAKATVVLLGLNT